MGYGRTWGLAPTSFNSEIFRMIEEGIWRIPES